MQDHHRPRRSRLSNPGFAIGCALVAFIVVAPASTAGEGESPGLTSTAAVAAAAATDPPGATDPAAAPAGPQLSIAVDNGRTTTAAGDNLDYRITVQNLGVTDIHGLSVTQSVPTGLAFDSADAAGTAAAGSVDWDLDLKATQSATFHTTMTVVGTPDDLLRLATVACAGLPAEPRIVCASDSDQLPAGASAEAAAAALTNDPTTPMSGISRWWYLAGGIGLVLLVAAFAILLVRRRATPPRISHPATPGAPTGTTQHDEPPLRTG